MKHHIVPKSDCVKCFHRMDRAMNANPNEQGNPAAGDFTLCIRCGEIMVFDDNLELRSATEDEINADPEVKFQLGMAQHCIQQAIKASE